MRLSSRREKEIILRTAPDLPGAAAAGETEEETAELMRGAIELHLEGLKEDNLPIPELTTTARCVEISV